MTKTLTKTIPIQPDKITNGSFDKEIDEIIENLKGDTNRIISVSHTPLILGPMAYLTITIVIDINEQKVLLETSNAD